MASDHPLTITVEQAAAVLGVGRTTAYQLVRSGKIRSVRLGRRVVVPIGHLAAELGVEHQTVWDALGSVSEGE